MMDTFFPIMPPVEEEPAVAERILVKGRLMRAKILAIVKKVDLKWEPIIEVEIERILKRAKAKSAPGVDGLPTLVWKQL